MSTDNEFKIRPPSSAFDWIKEGVLFLVERPFSWILYSSFFSILFALSSNLVYLHSCACLFFCITANICRRFFTQTPRVTTLDRVLRLSLFISNFAFLAILVRFLLLPLDSLAALQDSGSPYLKFIPLPNINDFINPAEMVLSGTWFDMFDVFIFNTFYRPFYYIYISILAIFPIFFFFPLFVWKENSAKFSFLLASKILLANIKPVGILFAFFIMQIIVVNAFPLSAYPYFYILQISIIFHCWADIFCLPAARIKTENITPALAAKVVTTAKVET